MRFGFVVTYPDGRTVTEFQTDWLSLPNEPIKKVQLFDSMMNEYVLELSDFDMFYFSNEAISITSPNRKPTSGQLVAKLFGGVRLKEEAATQYRVEVIGEPLVRVEELPIYALKLSPSVMRPGVVDPG